MFDRGVLIIVRTLGERPAMLAEAVASIRAQDYPDVHSVVVWNGRELPTEENDGRPDFLLSSEPGSRTKAGNKGIKYALSLPYVSYVGFLDDDDVLYPNHVSKLVESFEIDEECAPTIPQTPAGVAYSDSQHVYCDALNRPKTYGRKLDDLLWHDELCRRPGRPNHAYLIRKSLLAVERFDESLDVSEDWDLWVRLSLRAPFIHVPGVTGEYRVREDGSNTTIRQKAACDRQVALNGARFLKLMGRGAQ